MKKTLIIIILIMTVLGLRLYPTLVSGMPFSTDGWPLIRNTEILIQNTPIHINSSLFDGYNNFWPGSSLFSAVFSEIINLPPISAMAIGIPLVAALALPLFYVIVKKLTQNSQIALLATGLLATAFPYTLFMAGVTKETFADPLYFSVILIFLLKTNWKTTLLFTVASITLVLSHHLTAFFTLGVIASTSIALYLTKTGKQQKANQNGSNILLTAILSAVTAGYFALYAYPALKLNITASDLLTVAAYQILVISATIYFIQKSHRGPPLTTAFKAALICLGLVVFFFVVTTISVVPEAPALPSYYFLYATPLILAVPLTVLALNRLHEKSSSLMVPVFWLLPVFAFAFYGVFANPPEGLSFAFRSINFILPPTLILVAIGLHKLYTAPVHFKTRKLAGTVAVALIVSMFSLNVYSLYSSVSLQEPYLGYFWRYEPTDYQASGWVASSVGNSTVAGDSKVYYLLGGYFNRSVSITQGFNYLGGDGSAPQILYVYNQMFRNGYVLYQGTPIALPVNWTNKLADYNCVYVNSEVTIYAK